MEIVVVLPLLLATQRAACGFVLFGIIALVKKRWVWVSKNGQYVGAEAVRFRSEPSDNGNLLADASFGAITDPAALATELASIPGLVEHGLFLADMVERVVVADERSATIRELTP